jgi:hypothetical protein
MLNNIFPLHTKTQNSHLVFHCIHAEHYNVNHFHFQKLLMLMNNIILTINGYGTVRALGI